MKAIYFLIIVLFVACGQNRQTANDTEQEDAETVAPIEQTQPINTQADETLRVTGELCLDPQYQADVHALTGGIIRQILVTEGNTVVAGQTVAYLENTAIVELQKEYLTQKQEALTAEQECNRQQELFSQGAGVEKTLQQATANQAIAKARLTGLEKQLQQLSIHPEQVSAGNIATQIPIKAPIAGAVHKITVNTGSYADAQTSLMSITDNARLHCDLKVFEKDIPFIRVGQEVDITLINQRDTVLKGVIYAINQSFEEGTKALPVHVRLAGATHARQLLPGMYVTAVIHIR